MAEQPRPLDSIENSFLQDKAVRKAMAERLSVVYFAPDPDNPREGFYVEMPPVIQATYRCGTCPRIVIATVLLPDVLNGRIAKVKNCIDCKARMSLRTLGPEKERPVVIREKPKAALEEFIEGD